VYIDKATALIAYEINELGIHVKYDKKWNQIDKNKSENVIADHVRRSCAPVNTTTS
jgi:hypothetical protein